VGIVVPVLPPGCSPYINNGITYYGLNGLYYQPVMMSGVVQYRTVIF
jgi:hypothetical protein